MGDIRQGATPTPASLEEDPNATVVCSSPPCFMHELDPSYLGYLCHEEVSTLLGAVLAAEWGGAVPDEPRLRGALSRHPGAPGHHRLGRVPGEAPRRGPDGLARMIQEALPRIHDDPLRRLLGEVVGALEQGPPRRGGPQDEN
jgi:hypothetical protein